MQRNEIGKIIEKIKIRNICLFWKIISHDLFMVILKEGMSSLEYVKLNKYGLKWFLGIRIILHDKSTLIHDVGGGGGGGESIPLKMWWDKGKVQNFLLQFHMMKRVPVINKLQC